MNLPSDISEPYFKHQNNMRRFKASLNNSFKGSGTYTLKETRINDTIIKADFK
jgi:hypothetical protein